MTGIGIDRRKPSVPSPRSEVDGRHVDRTNAPAASQLGLPSAGHPRRHRPAKQLQAYPAERGVGGVALGLVLAARRFRRMSHRTCDSSAPIGDGGLPVWPGAPPPPLPPVADAPPCRPPWHASTRLTSGLQSTARQWPSFVPATKVFGRTVGSPAGMYQKPNLTPTQSPSVSPTTSDPTRSPTSSPTSSPTVLGPS